MIPIVKLTLYRIIRAACNAYYLLLVANVILSWVRVRENGVTRFISEVTEPVLNFFRRLLPNSPIPLDFSPVLAIIALEIAERLLMRLVNLL